MHAKLVTSNSQNYTGTLGIGLLVTGGQANSSYVANNMRTTKFIPVVIVENVLSAAAINTIVMSGDLL